MLYVTGVHLRDITPFFQFCSWMWIMWVLALHVFLCVWFVFFGTHSCRLIVIVYVRSQDPRNSFDAQSKNNKNWLQPLKSFTFTWYWLPFLCLFVLMVVIDTLLSLNTHTHTHAHTRTHTHIHMHALIHECTRACACMHMRILLAYCKKWLLIKTHIFSPYERMGLGSDKVDIDICLWKEKQTVSRWC